MHERVGGERPIRVLLADDHAVVRAGFRLLLDLEDDLAVIGEAGDGDEAVAIARAEHPDIVCMDVQMPGTDGVEATRRIVDDPDLGARVIMLTTFRDDEAVQASLRAGASGFVLKNSPPKTLVDSIRTVHNGDALLDPQVTMSVIAAMRRGSQDHLPSPTPEARAAPARESAPIGTLTEREGDVLLLVARGLSNADIARELFVSEATVKTHVSNLLAKLAVPDRVHAVIFAYEHGLVGPR